jgi:phosphoglycolate phosphatase
VATSKPQIFADRIVDHFELRKYLPKVYGAELGSERTDKSQLLAHALSSEGLSGTARDKVVMVGDRSHDIRGAKAQGILSVGVLWGYGTLEELGAAKPNRIVIDVDDLADVVSALI